MLNNALVNASNTMRLWSQERSSSTDNAEVAGSIPASPTPNPQFSAYARGGDLWISLPSDTNLTQQCGATALTAGLQAVPTVPHRLES